jgi:hypothetical protein
MAENDYSGANAHVIVPVIHRGEDSVHSVAVPADTPLPDFHDALLESGYHGEGSVKPPQWAPTPYSTGDFRTGKPRPGYGPTKEGVLENSPEFKAVGKAVFAASNYGRNSNEAGTYIDQNGERGPIVVSNEDGKMSMQVPKDAGSTIHSHPAHFQGATASPLPSQKDIETAKKLGKSVYVVSPEGLSVVEKDGKVTNIYNSKDWLDRNNR